MIDDSTMAAIGSRSRMTEFAAGEAMIDQGEATYRTGILVSGTAKVVHLTEEGDEQVLQMLEPGDPIGDPFGAESGVSWQAATDATLCWLPRGTLEAISREHPALYRAYLAGFVRALEDQRLWSAAMRGRSTLQRLAYWLARQPASASDDGTAVIEIDLCRRDLASLLDMSVETLCRGLHQVEHYGAIRLLTSDVVAVVDRRMLQDLSSVEAERAAPRASIGRARRTGKTRQRPPSKSTAVDDGTATRQ